MNRPNRNTDRQQEIIEHCLEDPVAFTYHILGERTRVEDVLAGKNEAADYPWAKQREAMRAIAQENRVVVSSGHSTGKTHFIVRVMLWFLRTKPGSVVIAVSPKLDQVKSLIFTRYRQLHQERGFPGEARTLSSFPDDRFPKWECRGFTSRQPEGLAGWHEPEQLFIFEEASGIDQGLYEAVEGMMSTEGSRWLLIGNPLRATGGFKEAAESNLWHHINISCWDHPNVRLQRNVYPHAVDKDWPEQMRKEWGEHSNLYRTRVLGLFPRHEPDVLIPMELLQNSLEYPRLPR